MHRPNPSETYAPSAPPARPARRRTRPRSASSLLVSRGSKRRFSSSTTSPAAMLGSAVAELDQPHRRAEQLTQPGGHRGERVLRVRAALRAGPGAR